MCEFKVIIKGNTVFKDAVYAKVDGNNVTVKDILGDTREFQNCNITEVNVNAARLVLSPIEHIDSCKSKQGLSKERRQVDPNFKPTKEEAKHLHFFESFIAFLSKVSVVNDLKFF